MVNTSSYTWSFILESIFNYQELTEEQALWAMNTLLTSPPEPEIIAAFTVGMTMKKVTVHEMLAFIHCILDKSASLSRTYDAVDIVGTGGDKSHSYNISTMSALTAAAAGVRVVKHGARSSSSKCGGADMLEQLGIDLEPDIELLMAGIEKCGIGFCYAPYFHPEFSLLAPTRKKIGVPTVFNWLGPLANPAYVKGGVVGCAPQWLMEIYAKMYAMDDKIGFIVRGNDGLDEITTTTDSHIISVVDGEIHHWKLSPIECGIPYVSEKKLVGGDALENSAKAMEVFSGIESEVADAVALNAGALIAVAQAIPGVCTTTSGYKMHFPVEYYRDMLKNNPLRAVQQGVEIAKNVLSSGEVMNLIASWKSALLST